MHKPYAEVTRRALFLYGIRLFYEEGSYVQSYRLTDKGAHKMARRTIRRWIRADLRQWNYGTVIVRD